MKKLIFITAMFVLAAMPLRVAAINLGGDLLRGAAGEAGYDPGTTETTFAENIGSIVQAAMAFLGIIFTALLVYAGFYWMIARGDEEKVKKAQSIIRASIIGLVIVLASYSISFFVLEALLSAR